MAFRDVVGHRRTIDLLSRSIARGTLPPSLIFAGPAAEKRAVAIALAQTLNCQSPLDLDACGSCTACLRIARGVHADVLILEPGAVSYTHLTLPTN